MFVFSRIFFLFGLLSLWARELYYPVLEWAALCAHTAHTLKREINQFFSSSISCCSIRRSPHYKLAENARRAQANRANSIPFIAFYKLRVECTRRSVQIETKRRLCFGRPLCAFCVVVNFHDHRSRMPRIGNRMPIPKMTLFSAMMCKPFICWRISHLRCILATASRFGHVIHSYINCTLLSLHLRGFSSIRRKRMPFQFLDSIQIQICDLWPKMSLIICNIQL